MLHPPARRQKPLAPGPTLVRCVHPCAGRNLGRLAGIPHVCPYALLLRPRADGNPGGHLGRMAGHDPSCDPPPTDGDLGRAAGHPRVRCVQSPARRKPLPSSAPAGGDLGRAAARPGVRRVRPRAARSPRPLAETSGSRSDPRPSRPPLRRRKPRAPGRHRPRPPSRRTIQALCSADGNFGRPARRPPHASAGAVSSPRVRRHATPTPSRRTLAETLCGRLRKPCEDAWPPPRPPRPPLRQRKP